MLAFVCVASVQRCRGGHVRSSGHIWFGIYRARARVSGVSVCLSVCVERSFNIIIGMNKS